MSQTPDNLHEPIADLPNPELNPLLNPILGRHLGKWAHVYFTTAPEKREEALFELLEDLRAEEAANGDAATASNTMETADGLYSIICPRCERSNVRSQKYCGMCGALMPLRAQAAAAAASQAVGPAMFDSTAEAENTFTDDATHAESERTVIDVVERTTSDTRKAANTGSTSGPPTFASTSLLFQPEPEESPDWLGSQRSSQMQPPSPVDIDWLRERNFASSGAESGGSRVIASLLGIAIVLCIGILVYLLALRPNEVAKTSTATPSSAANWNPTQNAPTQMPTVHRSETGDNNSAAPPPMSNTPTPNAIQKPPVSTASSVTPQNAPAHEMTKKNNAAAPSASAPPSSDSEQSGALEVSVAKQYLSGTNGHPDGAAAEKVLWDAVQKGNSNAILMLSDLYASGNGVARNCDQARLLLQVALRKNLPTADTRWQALQKTCR